MRYEMMRPHQIRQSIAERVPVVLPLGVLEYHGEHLAVGLDTLVVVKCLECLEAEQPLVILPPFTYGAASYAVAGPEGTGSVQVGAEALLPLAQQLFTSLLRIGFRNIHVVVHHQTENFAAGMPTDLAFKLAARQAIFAFLEQQHGEGWWGNPAMADYYAEHDAGKDPFNWIKAHPLMTPEITKTFPFDHAGLGETSLLLALAPEGVEMSRVAEGGHWYVKGAEAANADLGRQGVDMVLARLRTLLFS
ncbi:MAG: creatininase family protein [Hyphomicrobiaceae bacterium]